MNEDQYIVIEGAAVHNLKKINVHIPRNKLVVVTGVSGSGKSSLAFDTLFAEGQRRYIESLSAYARQFLGKIEKPAVDRIRGISPAIAIEQKTRSGNPRSTVGSITEIYDYLRLLYARIGKTISPISGAVVKSDTPEDVIKYISSLEDNTKLTIYAPHSVSVPVKERLSLLLRKGFTRYQYKGHLYRTDDEKFQPPDGAEIEIMIDRFVIGKEILSDRGRIADSVETAFFEGQGHIKLLIAKGATSKIKTFSDRFERDGMQFEKPSVHLFNFNSPLGACPKCEGFGSIIGIDKDLVVPDQSMSVYEGAIVCWKGEKMRKWKDRLVMNAIKFKFPIHKPFCELNEEQKELLWTGNKYFRGLNAFFKYVEKKSYKIQYRVMLSRFRGRTECPECKGTRLAKNAAYVKIKDKSIGDILSMQANMALDWFNRLQLSKRELKIAERLITEIRNRLQYLCDSGLAYLCLNRPSATLSGGEFQRVNLAASLGNNLSGSMYILDEPSVGLHPVDTNRLLAILHSLKQLGNTVIVVEHEELIIHSADYIIDLGPFSGIQGGEVMYQGSIDGLLNKKQCLTADYLSGRKKIAIPASRRKWLKSIRITGACHNNLKQLDVVFPLEAMTVVCGVSGSGKSSLVIDVLSKAMMQMRGQTTMKPRGYKQIGGDVESIARMEVVDQAPIGKSSRSNPVTYLKAFDEIRALFAKQKISKIQGFRPAHFSFNVDGGRCEACQGEGQITVEMQFMADVHLQCDQCKGKRYKEEILEVKYRDKNIFDVLSMTIDEALLFFRENQHEDNLLKAKICKKLQPLQEVGLGYLPMGQASNTLSGGEAQRVKLAYFLSGNQGNAEEKVLFIFDEPTTGLHFHDIGKLMASFHALLQQGHTIVIIEHNIEVIKCADWVIELGPGGGTEGGNLLFEGTPEELLQCTSSKTAPFLARKIPSV